MNEKLLSLLGIARRAGRLSMGFDAASESMNKGEAALLLLAEDLSERSRRTIMQTAALAKTPTADAGFDMKTLGLAVGRKQTGIIAVNDSGFAKSLKALCTENSQEECI